MEASVMRPPVLVRLVAKDDDGGLDVPTLTFGSVVRKTVLLNAAVVLTAFALAAVMGGPEVMAPVGVVLAVVTVLIWFTTFMLYAVGSIVAILWRQQRARARRGVAAVPPRSGVGDAWLDGPG
jgi:hypothetical protein